MSPPTDRPAFVAGAVLIVFAVSGLLDNSGLFRHDWRWTIAVIVVVLADVVAVRTLRGLVRSPAAADEPAPPTGPEG